MPISWNEIRQNAIGFARDWAGARRETADKQTFWNEFFAVFGIRRRTVAAFEEPVRRISGEYGYIDLLWRGMLLVEHKSRGGDLGKAESQAFRYIQDLVREGRHEEVPRYVIISDFVRIALHDLEPEDRDQMALMEFPLAELHRHIHDFAFIPGYQRHRIANQDPINLRAVGIMGDLHDSLESGGYRGHELERFLVRVLFCLFAEDTGIFEREAFRLYVEDRTKEDGTDLGPQLARLFSVLNTPLEERQRHLDETLAAFPYVNGELFAETLGFADLNRDMRNSLLACTRFDWSRISPAIFGSLFQGVMEPRERRQIGGHYTSERDILKVIQTMFLDDLRTEFNRIKGNKIQLRQFQQKLSRLRFLDPACGCGNFLVITYRELRLLEIELLVALNTNGQQHFDIHTMSAIDVDAFFGIEISEWPARIAEVAMWLMDHQMNLRLSEAFGQYFVRLPLAKSPTIVHGNALQLDWKQILPPEMCSYVLGNPPFVGAKYQTREQRADLDAVIPDLRGTGLLDYVVGWYFKAAGYIRGMPIVVGFVSTNSITQGEQVGVIWGELFRRGMHLHFGHRTFAWDSEARGKAHVHVVIIGFGERNGPRKRLYDYEPDPANPTVATVRNLSPYLVEGTDTVIVNRSAPVNSVPEIGIGNKPIDDGNYLFSDEEKSEFLKREPKSRKWFRRWVGSEEFINGTQRWCLWLGDCLPTELREMPEAMNRVKAVRAFRLASKSIPTQRLAGTPTRFHVENMPRTKFLVIPKVSSERRRYIPIGFNSPKTLVSDLCFIMRGATLYHFGTLSSTMHMAWVRQVCGRLKSDYRYSAKLVYNNFPWPETPADKQRSAVEVAARAVLDARAKHQEKGATLADLYDPLLMPRDLAKAHAKLDRAVDRCYRSQPFTSDRQRVEYLFLLYEKLTTPLIARTPKKGR
jgi:hypothetical protein